MLRMQVRICMVRCPVIHDNEATGNHFNHVRTGFQMHKSWLHFLTCELAHGVCQDLRPVFSPLKTVQDVQEAAVHLCVWGCAGQEVWHAALFIHRGQHFHGCMVARTLRCTSGLPSARSEDAVRSGDVIMQKCGIRSQPKQHERKEGVRHT